MGFFPPVSHLVGKSHDLHTHAGAVKTFKVSTHSGKSEKIKVPRTGNFREKTLWGTLKNDVS